MKSAEPKIRDILAVPFAILSLLFLNLTIRVGGMWTAQQMVEHLGKVSYLVQLDMRSQDKDAA
jgi:hypothetical protein